ncbi:hypothetical protein ACFL59_06450 [Planctomycetota bacterium]
MRKGLPCWLWCWFGLIAAAMVAHFCGKWDERYTAGLMALVVVYVTVWVWVKMEPYEDDPRGSPPRSDTPERPGSEDA